MTGRHRITSSMVLGLTIAGLVILVGSLSQIEFHPGQPFSLEHGGESGSDADLQSLGEPLFLMMRGVLGLAIAALPLYVIVSLITAKGRQRLLADIVALLTWLVIIWLFRLSAQPGANRGDLAFPALPPLGDASSSAPTATFVADVPQWLTWLAGLVVASLIVGVAGVIWMKRHARGQRSARVLDQLAQEAQAAIDTLEAGGDLNDTVIRCYFEMSQVLHREQGIQRAAAMTVREFEGALRSKGFPAQPVHVLTRLFEEVRYGNRRPDEWEEQMAIDSLSAIVAFGRSSA
jgi:hypothetical protein